MMSRSNMIAATRVRSGRRY